MIIFTARLDLPIHHYADQLINLSWRPGLVLAPADTKVWSGVPQLREGCWQLGQDLVSSKLTFVPLKLRENIRRLNPGCTRMETGFQRIWEQSKKIQTMTKMGWHIPTLPPDWILRLTTSWVELTVSYCISTSNEARLSSPIFKI
jgi:hypothetical protein